MRCLMLALMCLNILGCGREIENPVAVICDQNRESVEKYVKDTLECVLGLSETEIRTRPVHKLVGFEMAKITQSLYSGLCKIRVADKDNFAIPFEAFVVGEKNEIRVKFADEFTKEAFDRCCAYRRSEQEDIYAQNRDELLRNGFLNFFSMPYHRVPGCKYVECHTGERTNDYSKVMFFDSVVYGKCDYDKSRLYVDSILLKDNEYSLTRISNSSIHFSNKIKALRFIKRYGFSLDKSLLKEYGAEIWRIRFSDGIVLEAWFKGMEFSLDCKVKTID